MYPAGVSGDVRHPRVLVVEDEARVRDVLVESLSRAGCVTAAAADGAEAWHMLPEFQPDLMVLDLVMPGAELDGFGLLARLGDAHPPIVVISGLSSGLHEALRGHVAAVLSKPVFLDDVLREVKRLVGSAT